MANLIESCNRDVVMAKVPFGAMCLRCLLISCLLALAFVSYFGVSGAATWKFVTGMRGADPLVANEPHVDWQFIHN